MTDMKGSTSTVDIHTLHKEWDEASCPICMDHPHNAVLLVCSSHDKGCRSYICDTSYRHSNCLDRYKKLCLELRSSHSGPSSSLVENPDSERNQRSLHDLNSESIFGSPAMRRNLVEAHEDYSSEENNEGSSVGLLEGLEENNTQELGNRYSETTSESTMETGLLGGESLSEPGLRSLKCPLCRGSVVNFEIVKEARQYLDLKQRTCSRESCAFSGNYRELRRHARRIHPATRPADVDPSRQRAWRHLEHQREYGDIVSAIRSAMPGAIVLGDYVIDNGGGERESSGSGLGVEGSGPWWTTFFLFHMISSPLAPADDERRSGLSRALRRHRRSSGAFSSRRNLWGENLLGLQDESEDWDLLSDIGGDEAPVPRRRRRFTRARPDDEDQS
eukprot:TRINITY_DN1162_c0_g2_i1.p1 TRINITY_DN1162_c0_g2~~TRINITY_DN1162_c0_g2_i1.p1  ORF type:complete len:389 (+),score=55.22 TRINITY_DN1162_c0_g2_i1:398-1564(+)